MLFEISRFKFCPECSCQVSEKLSGNRTIKICFECQWTAFPVGHHFDTWPDAGNVIGIIGSNTILHYIIFYFSKTGTQRSGNTITYSDFVILQPDSGKAIISMFYLVCVWCDPQSNNQEVYTYFPYEIAASHSMVCCCMSLK